MALISVPLQLQSAGAAPVLIQGTGASAATALNNFTAALGGANNGTAPPPAASGFRRINWDGVPTPASGGNTIVANKVGDVATDLFQPRGVVLSDDNAVANDGFASVNPAASTAAFPAFTSPNIFAPYNDNQVEVNFVFASARGTTPTPAATKGFGAIFEGVIDPNATTIEFFHGPTSLRKDAVPVSGNTQVFLGVVFDSPIVTRVVITLGQARIFDFSGGPTTPGGNDTAGQDLVTADDFVYGEPMCTKTLGAVSSPTIIAGNGDVVCLNGTTVNGSVIGNPGSVVMINNAFVTGNVSTTGSAFMSVCGSTVRGSVMAQSATGFVRVGDAANDDGLNCNPNNVRSSVSVLNSRAGFEIGGNQVGGNLTANDNSLPRIVIEARPQKFLVVDFEGAEVEGNVVGGDLTCLRNSPPVTFDEKPNTVTGAVNCQTNVQS